MGGLTTVVVLAVAMSAVLDARDAGRLPAGGELVELSDGRMLHVQVAGEQHTGATVLLDAGHGMFSPAFAWLYDELSAVATVVAYDRPGYGWSEAADRPVSAEGTAADLHDALAARGLSGPYVLVGHSLGGLYVRAFADRYRDDVAGLVLLDPAHEDQLEHLPADTVAQMEQMNRVADWGSRLARLGVFRLHNPQDAILADLPDTAADQFAARSATAGYWRTTAVEGAAFSDLAAAVPADFGGVPVRIVSAPAPLPDGQNIRAVMDTLNRELASRSLLATHEEVAGADHLTLLTDPDHAREVSRIVADLLQDVGLN